MIVTKRTLKSYQHAGLEEAHFNKMCGREQHVAGVECLSAVTRSQDADGGQVGREKLISVSEKLLVYDLCDLKLALLFS